jgi:branched-chain amino acid transport system permease protein
MSGWRFIALALAVLAIGALLPRIITNGYLFYVGFVVLQYVVIATGWNILGGYAGYVNFGSGAFVGLGVYTAVFAVEAFGAPLWLQIAAAAMVGGLLGLAMGYLTLRIQGVYFSIATLALTVVINTVIVNWRFVGGAQGITVLAPPPPAWFPDNVSYLCFVMLILAVVSITVARAIERSWIGRGLTALRADEKAAECAGVATLRLKLLAAAVSGAVIAMAGAPYLYYASRVDPESAFMLDYALNALAMPLIGGTRSWAGPLIGALLLGTIEQATLVMMPALVNPVIAVLARTGLIEEVTITAVPAEVNLLIVGLVLIGFVVAAPGGLLGFADRLRAARGKQP